MGERWYRDQMKPRRKRKAVAKENFGAVAMILRKNGFVPIPLDGKKPMPQRWSGFWLQPPSEASYAKWLKNNGNANVGICTGEVIAIDIDVDEQAAAQETQEQLFSILGPTAFIRIGRVPRRTCLYRLTYEDARQTHSWKLGRIELLADGRQCAVFGTHPDTGQPFSWPQRSILGVSKTELPLITADALIALRRFLEAQEEPPRQESRKFTMDYSPAVGERDKYLFWFAKEMAATSGTLESLTEAVLNQNGTFSQPLTLREATAKATSAWKLKEEDKLLLSGANAPTIIPTPRSTIAELITKLDPQAAKLLIGLAATRHTSKEFTIPQKATAEAFKMSEGSLKKGLKQLLTLGILTDTGKTRVSLQPRPAKIYRFGAGNSDRRMFNIL